MDRARWREVQELFHRVADLDAPAQEVALATAAEHDAALVEAVRALLAGDADRTTLLDRGLAAPAQAVLEPEDADVPAVVCGPYRLVRRLGAGGMGVVYLATRDDLGSAAAVKLLRDAWFSPARRARFEAEQRTLAQLNHPAIAHLLDAGALPDGTPWIAMEYVDGVSLREHCARAALPLRDRLRLLQAVGEGVRHAHQHLVVHRDLKPSNIMVRADGSVKLLDFGIAKQLEHDGAAADPTRTGLRHLTPAYAAPEQLTGGAVGVQADVYALGVVLYELLTGTLPYDLSDSTPGAAEARVLAGDAPRPSARARRSGSDTAPERTDDLQAVQASDRAWRELDVLCLTAMHRDPARRYASVEAFLRDLGHFLRGEPLDARGDSWRYRVGTRLRRHARAVTAAAMAAVALLLVVSFYTVRLAQARDRAVEESVRAQRIQQFMSGLFQGGDEAAGPAESLRVITLLDDGVAAARALDNEPRVQADFYQTLGGIHAQLGLLPRADSLLSTGLAQWQRIAGDGSEEAARARIALGDLRTAQARYDEADTLLRDGLRVLDRQGPAASPARLAGRTALARLFTERGEHARAVALLDSLVATLRGAADDSAALHEALGELANAHFYGGDYDAADTLNREVIAMTRARFGARHPRVAEDLMNLGATEQERGNYVAAEQRFREAHTIATAFHGTEHFRVAGILTYLGRALLLQGRHAEAREHFERALAIRERVFGSTHPFVANTLNELGSLAIREERYADAARIFERVRGIYQAAYSTTNYRVGVATGNLADVYLNQRAFARAEAMYREALTIYEASQGPTHLNTGIGHIKLGRSLLRLGRLREAMDHTERGYRIVQQITAPEVSFLQAARLDLSLALDSLGRPEEAARWRAERERYLPQ